jgi:hypothetical protein
MDFDNRSINCRNRIRQGNGGVRISSGIDNDTIITEANTMKFID